MGARMVQRAVLPLCAIGALLVAAWWSSTRPAASARLRGSTAWEPTLRQITRAVGKGRANATDGRREQFASMFKERYRQRGMAIGVDFDPDGTIALKCAPILPRWDIARIGQRLHHEALDIFGEHYRINIYETYISLPRLHVGEIRPHRAGKHLRVQFFREEDIRYTPRGGPMPRSR